jgi:hypothetical protein
MADRALPNLGLKGFWTLGEDLWKDDHDRNLLLLSVLVQGGVIDKVSATPGVPTDGDVYLYDETHPTDPNKIAIRDAGAWVLVTPLEGWLLYDRTANHFLRFSGTAWTTIPVLMSELADVNFAGLADGQGLRWDATAGEWVPADVMVYAVPLFYPGSITAINLLMLVHTFVKPVTLPGNAAGSKGGCGVTSTADAALKVYRAPAANPVAWTQVGTITFVGGTHDPVFATTSGDPVLFAAGDHMKIAGPGALDSTLADINFTLLFHRDS